MRRLASSVFIAGLVGSSLSLPAMAHDVGSVYPRRGECESALAQINTEDRKFLVEIGEFETEGEANRWFHEVFRCELQGSDWVLVFDPEE